MMRGTAIAVILLLPTLVFGATLEGQRNVVVTEPPIDNLYTAGAEVRINAPVTRDLTAAGGAVTVAAPVVGDALLAGGTLNIEESIGGDLRAAGARVTIENTVAGDVAVLGGAVISAGRARDIHIVGGTVRVTGGADGNVNIYGNDVFLAGEYFGNVQVSSSDRVTIGEGTIIHGSLAYNAPQRAVIPNNAEVRGGVAYTGAASYLPSPEQAEVFSILGIIVFFIVKVLAALVAAGLIVGLFPRFSARVVERVRTASVRKFVLLALLGFALVVAVPILIVLLLISFVGIGIALVLAALYLLLLMLSYVYAGLLVGTVVVKLMTKRIESSWQIAILGMFLLYLIGLIPVLGGLIVFILMLVSAGVLARIAYLFAWRREP